MKCIILAGGKGDRLWPLSRKNYPKQFIQIQGDHSIFQETIARNMPYCDEFIIVTNQEYQFIINNQLSAFQSLTYRCIFEGEGRKTAAAITLACMQLPLSEIVLIVPSDQLIAGMEYKDDLMHARELCEEGNLVTFGMPVTDARERFGYIRYQGENVLRFTEKPSREEALQYQESGEYMVNSGMFVFCVGHYLSELGKRASDVYEACREAFRMRQAKHSNLTYPAEVMRRIPAEPVEKAVFEKTERAKVVHASFQWKDIGSLEDLKATELKTAADSQQVQYMCSNTDIINQCSRRVVVTNGLHDVVVVNTKDAVYVGKKGESNKLKQIFEVNPQMLPFVEGGRVTYRQWGSYELLVDQPNYRVKKIMIQIGKTIYAHKHLYRSEHWSVVAGTGLVELAGEQRSCGVNDVTDVNPGVIHQVSNIGNVPLIIIEVSVGENVSEEDSVPDYREDLPETALGITTEPFVKLLPAFKDYLWGGSRLKEKYHKRCDFQIVAESWELSAHEAGQSVVASGRHGGMLFAEYLNSIGKNNWGWKCLPLDAFPLMIKFIDAKDFLSVQVHPDDDYALAYEGQYGKNEMWYIVDCEPEAFIYCGFNRTVSRGEVLRRLENNTILEILNKVPVSRGEAYFIPAGTVHAIGAGILICEIQQSSNCTYRLYDFDRRDKFGNLRELHIQKALDVLRYEQYMPQKLEDTTTKDEVGLKRVISRCKYFECTLYQLNGLLNLALVEESFTSLICISGCGTVALADFADARKTFREGDSIFIPKSDKILEINGDCKIIVTRV